MSQFTTEVEAIARARHAARKPMPTDMELAQSITDAMWLIVGELPEHSRTTITMVAADLLRRSIASKGGAPPAAPS